MEVNAAAPTEPAESEPDGIRFAPRYEQAVSADGHAAQQVSWWHDLGPPDAFHRATKLIEFIGGIGSDDTHRRLSGGRFSIVMRCLEADHPKCSACAANTSHTVAVTRCTVGMWRNSSGP